MEANLIFKTPTDELILETKELKEIDESTYSFRTEEKLRNKYHLENAPGQFLISYQPDALPLEALYLYNFNDEEIEEEKYLSLNLTTRPLLSDFKREIEKYLDDFETMKKFYVKIKDYFTSEENLYFSFGIAYKNKEFCLRLINQFLSERLENSEGYFFSRYLKDFINNLNEDINEMTTGRITK